LKYYEKFIEILWLQIKLVVQSNSKIRIVKLINQFLYLSIFENIFIKNDNEIISYLKIEWRCIIVLIVVISTCDHLQFPDGIHTVEKKWKIDY